MPGTTVRAADLEYGQVVVGGSGPGGFTVHAVTQAQGRVQVTDTTGRSHTFSSEETVDIR